MKTTKALAEGTSLGCILFTLFLLLLTLIYGRVVVTDHPVVLIVEIIIVTAGLVYYIKTRRIRFTLEPIKRYIKNVR